MNRQIRNYLLSAASLLLTATLVTGCGGLPGDPPSTQVTVETDYGYGFGNVGYTQVDPNVNLTIANADPSCSNGSDVNYFKGKTDKVTGQATFPITCPSGQYLLAVRYPDTNGTNNCDAVNSTDSNQNPVWIYDAFYGTAAPTIRLPCGQRNTLFVLSPSQMYANSPASSLTMTGPAGSFTSNYGMPWVYFTDATGTLYGQVTATSIAPDGSSITFPTTPLVSPQNAVPPGNYMVAVSNVVASGTAPQISGSVAAPQPNFVGAFSTSLVPVGGDVLSVTAPILLHPTPIPMPVPCSGTAIGPVAAVAIRNPCLQ